MVVELLYTPFLRIKKVQRTDRKERKGTERKRTGKIVRGLEKPSISIQCRVCTRATSLFPSMHL